VNRIVNFECPPFRAEEGNAFAGGGFECPPFPSSIRVGSGHVAPLDVSEERITTWPRLAMAEGAQPGG